LCYLSFSLHDDNAATHLVLLSHISTQCYLTHASDDTTYDTVFQTTKGDTLILRVNFPLASSFAAFCPAMTLAGVRVRHPWVDSSNRMRITGYDPIQSEQAWKDSGVLLGEAVHAVVKHLQLNPPAILEITDKGLQSIQTNQRGGGSQSAPSSMNGNSKTQPRSPHGKDGSTDLDGSIGGDAPPSYNLVADAAPAPDVPMPDIPMKFSEVEGLSRAELDTLMEDQLEFLTLVHKLNVFDQIYTIESSRLNENFKLANENLATETQWTMLRSEVKHLHSTLQSKILAFSKMEEKQNEICAPPDKALALAKLSRAKKEAFDVSESLAEAWVENGGNVDDYVKQFLESRTLHHMRAAKVEILKNSNDS
jgi:Modifier of rudimentary (Mod(r)) protein